MPTISIITAVAAGRHQYLLQTYESLRAQQLPAGWCWEWLVQEDGTTGVAPAGLPRDPRISFGQARAGRACTARTLALGRAHGVLVRALDADDLLPADALARDITTLVDQPDLGWTVAPAVDLLPDGSLRPGPRDPVPGRLRPGLLAEAERADRLPVVGTTLCTYTTLVQLLSGWPALPGAEDVGLMLAVEAVAVGWVHAEPGLVYRKWDGSSTADPAHREPGEETARRTVTLARVGALRESGWRWSPAGERARLDPAVSTG